MKSLFKFRYPKLFILLIAIIASYLIFSNSNISEVVKNLGTLNYLGIFLAGLLFSFGFTTPFAIGFFLTTSPENIFLAAIIGGFGALLSDFIIFRIIKVSFMDEFNSLEKTRPLKNIIDLVKHHIPTKIKIYLLYVFSGIIIASPLPDELGVTMLAGLTHIKNSVFIIISLICNTLGILIMLLI